MFIGNRILVTVYQHIMLNIITTDVDIDIIIVYHLYL